MWSYLFIKKNPEIIPVYANSIYLIFRTALHLACANGHVDVVTFLVENKCKLNLFDNDNRSPLMKVRGLWYVLASETYCF